ncbi:MAG: type II toxin-antitoxin system VapC family toxin [Acidimicrobiales bacterium]
MIYLDTSALLKILFHERESGVLARWLTSRADVPKVSSELCQVEAVRACRRIDEGAVPSAVRLLSGLDLVPITKEIIERAALVGAPSLRSLDAIHLASALLLRADLSSFVAYDRRLQEAAEAENLAVVAPI